MLRLSLLVVLAFLGCRAHAAPDVHPPLASFRGLGFPASLDKPRLQRLLQRFVARGYGRSFRHLGDERDFDHGHLLLDARTGAPFAILYHTQELAHAASAADFGYVDAAARNWIQWLDGRGIENASRYERAAYPDTPSWNWFVASELPGLRSRRTITDKMLDPARLGSEISASVQWTFTRVDCATSRPGDESNVLDVVLPDRTPVCVAVAL